MGVLVLVLQINLIQIKHRLDFVKIKKIKFLKNISVFLKIAHVIDDTSGKNYRRKKGGTVLVSEQNLSTVRFFPSVKLSSDSNKHVMEKPYTLGSSFIVMKPA